MTSRLVPKLFLLTTMLCALILAVVYIGQTVFFKAYYVDRKVKDIRASLEVYKKHYEAGAGDAQAVQTLEQDFYRERGGWLVVLDAYGTPIQANPYEVRFNGTDVGDRKVSYTVPLYQAVGADEASAFKELLAMKSPIWIYGIAKGSTLIPAAIRTDEAGGNQTNTFINARLNRKLDAHIAEQFKAGKGEGSKAAIYEPFTYAHGYIAKTEAGDLDGGDDLVRTNPLLLDRINEFQTELLLNSSPADDRVQALDFEQANVKYKLFIQPAHGAGGGVSYLFAMASLQPVDEAVRAMRDYFVYMIAFVMLLVVLASLYYSVAIVRPLLRMTQMTKRLAALDFTAVIPIKSKDEIGDLSRHINSLSQTLHAHIRQLQADIEKEKRLENTRKEFIAGVSHELKTPLSVMKSCISILKDGVAPHKKEHYFAAMEKEVDKMDALIVGMLELAKYESGTYRMETDAFRIDTVIEAVCEQFAADMADKRLTLRTELMPVEVVANRLRIEQVITNFMTNAVRYSPEGEAVLVSAVEKSDDVVVTVENTGTRIPPGQLDHVWDRFFRGDTSRQRSRQGGTGLGLAISKNILELHGAEYGVRNTKNGVAFHFRLRKNARRGR